MYKRILVLAPAVWLLASIVFLLSKNIPGSAADYQFEQAGQNPNSVAQNQAKQRAYRQHLKRTGQDLPLFYVGLATMAEPDTLYKIYPEKARQFLLKQLRLYGNWQAVSDYYRAVASLQHLLASTDLSEKPVLVTLSGQLLSENDPGLLVNNLAELQTGVKKTGQKDLFLAVNGVETAMKRMMAASPGIAGYLPALHWYGFGNQYHTWLAEVFKGNLGVSSRDGQPVTNLIAEAFKFSFLITLSTLVLIAGLAILTGMFLSSSSGGFFPNLIQKALYVLDGLPLFIIALFFLLVSGSFYAGSDSVDFYTLIPLIGCLVLVNLPYLTSQFRAAMEVVLKQEYILTARAKGLSGKQVLWQHAFRNAVLPVITLISDFIPSLLAGTVVLEVIFSVPGIGRLLTDSVLARDYNVIIGIVLLIGALRILSYMAADLAYKAADPRIRI